MTHLNNPCVTNILQCVDHLDSNNVNDLIFLHVFFMDILAVLVVVTGHINHVVLFLCLDW